MSTSRNFPFKHNPHDNEMTGDSNLSQVELAKQREYLLKMLNYKTDTVISMKQLEEEFSAIVDFEGI